jgi:hypothetical protein
MDIRLEHTAVKLAQYDTINIIDGKGSRIAARSGNIWITQEHDVRDVILRPGQSFTLDRNGTAVIEALTGAEVALDAPGNCVESPPRSNLTSLAVLGYVRPADAPHRVMETA